MDIFEHPRIVSDARLGRTMRTRFPPNGRERSSIEFPLPPVSALNRTSRFPALPVVASALFLAALKACDAGGVAEPEPSLEIVPDSVTLTHIGKRFAFSVRSGGGLGASQIQWSSRDTSVFTVDATGTVTARGNGVAAVRASDLKSADHALVQVRQLAAGSVGYRAEDGGLVLVEDPLAGRFEGWRSLLLLGIGFTALLLAVWKWFGGREPIPHFARLHGARDATARELETEYADSLRRLEEDERRHRQRLGDAEAELLALGGRLTGLDAARRQLLAREAELLRLTAAAGASAVEDYREANRQRRLSHDPPPSFWTTPWAPALQDRDKADDAAWGREHEQGLYEVMEAAERVRIANAAHAAPVAEAFAEARERLAQAARIPGARRRPPGPPGGGSGPPSGGKPGSQEVRLVPRAGQDPSARLEIAS